MAHFGRALNRGGSQTVPMQRASEGRKAAGQRLVSLMNAADGKVSRSRSDIGVFPMTHHVECVALLTRG